MSVIVESADKLKAAGSQSSITITGVTTTGTNRALVVDFVKGPNSARTVSGVTRGSDTYESKVSKVSPTDRILVEMWGSTNEPATASTDLVGTISGTETDFILGYRALSGVDQTTRFSSPQSWESTGATSTAAAAVTSAVDDLVLDLFAAEGDSGTLTAGGSQTSNWAENTGVQNYRVTAEASEKAGAASVTMSWSWTTSNNAAHVAMNVNAADTATEITASVGTLAITGEAGRLGFGIIVPEEGS